MLRWQFFFSTCLVTDLRSFLTENSYRLQLLKKSSLLNLNAYIQTNDLRDEFSIPRDCVTSVCVVFCFSVACLFKDRKATGLHHNQSLPMLNRDTHKYVFVWKRAAEITLLAVKSLFWAIVKAPVWARAPSVRRLYGDCGRAVCPPLHTLRQSLCKGTEQPGQAGAIYSAALQSTHWRRASRVCARRRIKGSIPAMRVNKGRSEREGEAQKGPVCVCVRLYRSGPYKCLKGTNVHLQTAFVSRPFV